MRHKYWSHFIANSSVGAYGDASCLPDLLLVVVLVLNAYLTRSLEVFREE